LHVGRLEVDVAFHFEVVVQLVDDGPFRLELVAVVALGRLRLLVAAL
jgi:hypothetical protein